ncbi:MAG TPA: aminoacyl-tRNA hydrolase [Chloroflexota bacterium]
MTLLDVLRNLFRRPSAERLSGLDPLRTRLIVGLGNPGPEYADTRHNVGFKCVDELASRYHVAWQDKTAGLSSCVAVIPEPPELTIVLAKPRTFMNRSGTAVRDLIGFLKLDPVNTLIVYDEMDLPFGRLRLRERGSAGSHNGMRSVVSSLETENVARLRVGISQSAPGGATSHVLSEFTADEQAAMQDLIQRASDAAIEWAEHGAAVAMNRYNNS